jgi:prepilin-type N-terminal cleavage/methylation domain-containing protein
VKRKRGGFTLLELLIVIAIIVVLVAVAIPMVSSELGRARKVTCAANRRSLKTVVANAYMTGEYDSFQKAFDALYDKSVYTCPDGGTFSWKDDNDSGNVICSIHGDGSGSGQSSGSTAPADGSVTLKDSAGGTHTLSPNAKWTEVQQTITASGMNLPAGTIVSDSSGTYLFDSWNDWISQQDVSGMTAAQFAAVYPGKFIRLTNGGSVLTEADQTTLYGNTVWKAEKISSGTVCFCGGNYYVVPAGSSVNRNTLPPDGWIPIRQ